jgi:hypothetical protein
VAGVLYTYFDKISIFFKRFDSLGDQSPSVGSSCGYLQNDWQFEVLNYNFFLFLHLASTVRSS